jgi:ABC-type branched-subunit amino acid transport system substrate-binding protein
MRKVVALVAGALAVLAGCSTKAATPSSGTSAARSTASTAAAPGGTATTALGAASTASGADGPGVTPTTIRVGITYPDLTALRATLDLDAGNYQVAFTTLINDINAHGGINGRKIVPYFAPVNVIGTAPAAAACVQLTEDDKVFVVIGFFQAADTSCYVNTHDVPIVGASLTATEEKGAKAPWFNGLLSDDHLIPKELQVFNKQGVFAGHKVAVVGSAADQPNVDNVVLPELKSLGVDVVQSAIESAPNSDTPAVTQQYGLIDQKFRAVGADVVVAVGDSSAQWPEALQANRSSYLPRLVATTYLSLLGYTQNKGGFDPAVVKDAITGTSEPPADVYWSDPAMVNCVAMIQAAEPTAKIGNPITAPSKTAQTWFAPQTACDDATLLDDILKAAGPTLNNQTFVQGGESLKNITLPGSGGTLSFGPGHHDGDGSLFVFTWDSTTQTFKGTTANA